ncbi:MAG TPA: hypothetical protein VD815_01540 [Candidatus Saccharimonadales bacterium]|nr:hypothetical protein [Candidatus Saccharimonadales bacterium]
MDFSNSKNVYLKYTDIIHCAFEYYRDTIKKEIKNERENSNNFALIDFFDRIDKSLNRTKDYYIQNIGNIFKPDNDPNKHPNIGVFRSVLFVYSKDLERCKELLNRHYNLYPVGEGSIKEKYEVVKELLILIVQKPQSPSSK